MEKKKQPAKSQAELEAEKAKNARIKKYLIWGGVAVAAVVAIVLVWYLINKANSDKADAQYSKATAAQIDKTVTYTGTDGIQTPFGVPFDPASDSLALPEYEKAIAMGHDGGNNAAIMAAGIYYRRGGDANYKKALELLKGVSVDGVLAPVGVYSLQGDCYANLKQYKEAVEAWDKGISEADGNPEVTPFLLIKKANVYRAQNNFNEEYAALEEVMTKYTHYADQHPGLEHLYERAKAAAGK